MLVNISMFLQVLLLCVVRMTGTLLGRTATFTVMAVSATCGPYKPATRRWKFSSNLLNDVCSNVLTWPWQIDRGFSKIWYVNLLYYVVQRRSPIRRPDPRTSQIRKRRLVPRDFSASLNGEVSKEKYHSTLPVSRLERRSSCKRL